MTRRLEAGPLLVTLGALLLLVSLFLTWFTGEITAWEAFEVWDLVLFVLALGSIAAGVALIAQGVDLLDGRFLPAVVIAVATIVASQIIDPPPAAPGQDPDTGSWLALGATLVMCVGALLTYGRVGLTFTLERRDKRRHVSAVDARRTPDPTTGSQEAAGRQHLFARERSPEQDSGPQRAAARASAETEETKPLEPKRRGGKARASEKQD
jgi:hypothetical protein